MAKRSIRLEERSMERQADIRQLRGVLPYPLSWYEGLCDIEIRALWRRYSSDIVRAAIEYDERMVRLRANLPVGVARAENAVSTARWDFCR